MSDRSYVSIMFYDCPVDEWDDVINILNTHGINAIFSNQDRADCGKPNFRLEIIDEEVRLGSMSEACAEMSKAHPRAIFWGQQDAYYEYYGDRCVQVEEGYSWKETDNSGHVPLSNERLTALIEEAGSDVEKLKNLLHEHFGTEHFNAILEWRDGVRTRQYVIEEMPTL